MHKYRIIVFNTQTDYLLRNAICSRALYPVKLRALPCVMTRVHWYGGAIWHNFPVYEYEIPLCWLPWHGAFCKSLCLPISSLHNENYVMKYLGRWWKSKCLEAKCLRICALCLWLQWCILTRHKGAQNDGRYIYIYIIATMNAFTNNSLPIQDEVFEAKFAKKPWE